MIIQKRFQYFSYEGKVWTQWFKLKDGDPEELKRLKREDKFQLKPKLLNEYRIK